MVQEFVALIKIPVKILHLSLVFAHSY